MFCGIFHIKVNVVECYWNYQFSHNNFPGEYPGPVYPPLDIIEQFMDYILIDFNHQNIQLCDEINKHPRSKLMGYSHRIIPPIPASCGELNLRD